MKTGIDAIASNPAVVAVAGALLALVWAFTGWSLARQQKVLVTGDAAIETGLGREPYPEPGTKPGARSGERHCPSGV